MTLPKRTDKPYNIPADPAGDRMSEAIARRYGVDEAHYDEHLAKIRAESDSRRIGIGKYTKREWPTGFEPGKRKRARYVRPGAPP